MGKLEWILLKEKKMKEKNIKEDEKHLHNTDVVFPSFIFVKLTFYDLTRHKIRFSLSFQSLLTSIFTFFEPSFPLEISLIKAFLELDLLKLFCYITLVQN